MNKINEIIDSVNLLDPSGISGLETDVAELKSQMSAANDTISKNTSDISTNASNITALTSSVNDNTSDIENIKTTLYTPLESSE